MLKKFLYSLRDYVRIFRNMYICFYEKCILEFLKSVDRMF